ncbi:MATE family efflux transporter [Halobacteriovorax sp. JY17]|uniref:MATE family efflux transporter n=1 Tax=Halobacteriovorax sp. JY17 TaxID=2014617 RepID=UPI000C3FF0EC|nr:MATE family efflux transporter [Halobacteriovorax sp. JY17]PIK16196.1 MAG: hypothetical protein CES88_05530 [Halobacteriovorax sp. JY17]
MSSKLNSSGIKLTLGGLFFFSLPNIFGSLLEPVTGIIDTALIGNMNTTWLAALSLGVVILSSFTWVFNFLIHTSIQSVSEAYSLENSEQLHGRVKVALLLSLVVGVFSSLILYFCSSPLFDFVGARGELKPLALSYFHVRLIGQPFLILGGTLISILRGFERVKVCFILIAFSTIINSGLSWYLLYHTNIGLSAVAWGSVIGAIFTALLALLFVLRIREIQVRKLVGSPLRGEVMSFGRNSLNMFCRSIILTGSFFLCTKSAARLGHASLASHQILLEFWLFSSFLTDGLALSGNILAAKFQATKDFKSFTLMKKNLLKLSLFFGVSFALTYFFFENKLLRIFTEDELVLDIISKVWPYLALSQIFLCATYVYDGLLFGLGRFDFVRRQIFYGFIFSFLPFIIYSFYSENLLTIWLGLIALGAYRVFIGYIGTKKFNGALG